MQDISDSSWALKELTQLRSTIALPRPRLRGVPSVHSGVSDVTLASSESFVVDSPHQRFSVDYACKFFGETQITIIDEAHVKLARKSVAGIGTKRFKQTDGGTEYCI